MILFMILKKGNAVDEADRFEIPRNYPPVTEMPAKDVINEANVQIISWDQVNYQVNYQDGKVEIIEIKNTTDLWRAVCDAASQDPVCQDINHQFLDLYEVDILANFFKDGQLISETNPCFFIFKTLLSSWPHPMIGNILVSAGVRPQVYEDQYIKNWSGFLPNYMSAKTKEFIKAMISSPESVGLIQLEKSGRDQVRICKDMTELARAVMGELSTYATKKLEKIYALEICKSEPLLQEQIRLINDIIKVKKVEINGSFMAGTNQYPITKTEYIAFYFPELSNLSSRKIQWSAFAILINTKLSEENKLKYDIPVGKDKSLIDAVETDFNKFPPQMQCAMIINAIRKLDPVIVVDRYSITAPIGFDFGGETVYYIANCCIEKSASKEFIPELKVAGNNRNKLLWNWMRDERHLATQTYRHFLMPLWAGPSGHSTGIIAFFKKHLTDWKIEEIIRTVVPTMFAFWRLYYDKRISAVHTLAETYEAAFSFALPQVVLEVNGLNLKIENKDLIDYKDAFETVADEKVFNSVYIMALIRKKHYKDLKGLDKTIDDLRAELSSMYFIPTWSKPIEVYLPKETVKPIILTTFSGVTIGRLVQLNVKTFVRKPVPTALCSNLTEPSERLKQLYNNLNVAAEYKFSQDYQDLPECLIDGRMAHFLADVTFKNIKNCEINGLTLTFTATVSTEAIFWNRIKQLVKIKDEEEFYCKVTDDEGLNFTGIVNVNSEFAVSGNISLGLNKLIIASGLNKNSGIPQVKVLSSISDGQDTIDLTVSLPLYTGQINISGEYQDGKVLTIPKLLKLFRLDSVILATSFLPDDESVFGSLGLRSVSLSVSADLSVVYNIDFVITAENLWNIFDNKITLQPYFEIEIAYPFSKEKRNTDCTVMGKWKIGETEFDLTLTSDKIIYAALADNSVLNFAKVAELFANGVKFPEIKFTELSLMADFNSKNYSISISADDVLKFNVGKSNVEIQNIAVALNFAYGEFSELKLYGSLYLGGLNLNLSGAYDANNNFSFTAEAISDNDYCLRDFTVQIAKDISGNFNEKSIPEDFLTVNIRNIYVSYLSNNKSFEVLVDLDNVMKITDAFSINELKLKISCEGENTPEFEVVAIIKLLNNEITMMLSKANNEFIIEGTADVKDVNFKNIAEHLGIKTGNLPDFIAHFAVEKLNMQYNITQKHFKAIAETSIGIICTELCAGEQASWNISYKTNPTTSVDMLKMPVVGELVKSVASSISDFCIKDFEIDLSSDNGVQFGCVALGKECIVDIYKPKHIAVLDATVGEAFSGTVKWIEVNKTFAVISVQKIGIGLDGSKAVFLLDTSLNISPLTFLLTEAGVGVNISNPKEIAFYLSGFRVVFDNGILSIGGSFSRINKDGKDIYTGMLSIKFKQVGAIAIGEYSDGSIMAYLAVNAPIGGLPAFFVTGLAAGFGYNKRLSLPPIEKVQEFPLVTAAVNGFTPQTLTDLDRYITDESGQYFLSAGVKFTSFGIVKGFLLVTVSFGNECELALLGLADVSMPPNAVANPIAKAQLALKAAINPAVGVFSAEARLTSESYILSKSCKLTGGFAAYMWFGNNQHSGDFVITLGGYHPAYRKPEHYPTVPRLGLNWNVNSNINISGEIYFALTPSSLMAGGKLNAIYTQGNLNAWFIAYADFLINWKPFSYDVSIGVSIGASYRIDWWFIHKTFSVELAADLHLWGPELQGKLHISWFIISFTISFSEGKDCSQTTLDWNAFKESFLLCDNTNGNDNILTVSFDGIIGKTKNQIDIVSAEKLVISAVSKIPERGNVRPVSSAELKSEIGLNVIKNNGNKMNAIFVQEKITQNFPAALWKTEPIQSEKLNENAIVKDKVCGVIFRTTKQQPKLFPESQYISLTELYKKGTLEFSNCFGFNTENEQSLSDINSINKFTKNENDLTAMRRKKYLSDKGVLDDVSLNKLAENAENWFSENILIKKD